MSSHEIEQALDFAAGLVVEAGVLALAHFRRPLEIEDKRSQGLFDPVTVADRAVETLLRERLRERFPTHGIIGEEFGSLDGSSPLSWIIDPIDGTRAFISGLPAWGILVGLRENARPVAGLMHQPYLEETFAGGPAGGWFERHGKRQALASRQHTRLADATLYCTTPEMFSDADERAGFERIAARARLVRYGGDCYAYCLLALGHVDLVVESSLQPYDIQPLIPIVEAAGGVVSGPRGEDASPGGFVVAAANRALHREVLALLDASPP